MASSELELVTLCLLQPSLIGLATTSPDQWSDPSLAGLWREMVDRHGLGGEPLTLSEVMTNGVPGDTKTAIARTSETREPLAHTPAIAEPYVAQLSSAIVRDAATRAASAHMAAIHTRLTRGELSLADLPVQLAKLESLSQSATGRVEVDLRQAGARLLDAWNAPTATRLPTGVPELDTALDGGLSLGHVHVVAGNTNAGKSHYCLAVADRTLLGGDLVDYWTLEDSPEDTHARLVARRAGVPVMPRGSDVPLALQTMTRLGELGDRLVYLRQTQRTLRAWAASAIAGARARGSRMVVVDYIQRLRGGRGSIYERMVEASHAVGDIARETGAAVLVASQRNAAEDHNRSLKGAGEIAEDAYTVTIIDDCRVMDGRGETSTYPVVEVSLTKNKTGRRVYGVLLQRDERHGGLMPCSDGLRSSYVAAKGKQR